MRRTVFRIIAEPTSQITCLRQIDKAGIEMSIIFLHLVPLPFFLQNDSLILYQRYTISMQQHHLLEENGMSLKYLSKTVRELDSLVRKNKAQIRGGDFYQNLVRSILV